MSSRFRIRGSRALVLGVVLAACSAASSDTVNPRADFISMELATVGLDPAAEAPVVLLREPESGRVLPIWVGLAEAQAIARSLHGIEMPRPMTHDLLANVLRDLGAVVDEVRVNDLRDGTYYGAIVLRPRGQRKGREVDSRPSDALALALRTGAPIRVARRLLDAAPGYEFLAPDADEQVVQAVGLIVVAATPAVRERLQLPARPGVVVSRSFGGAEAAGLRRGDLIVRVNDSVPTEPIDFFNAVRATAPGTPVRITYLRGDAERTVELVPRAPARPPRRGARADT